jgi:hypothetical protein
LTKKNRQLQATPTAITDITISIVTASISAGAQ